MCVCVCRGYYTVGDTSHDGLNHKVEDMFALDILSLWSFSYHKDVPRRHVLGRLQQPSNVTCLACSCMVLAPPVINTAKCVALAGRGVTKHVPEECERCAA